MVVDEEMYNNTNVEDDEEYDGLYGMTVYKLTTIDNPFHPVDQYDDWRRFDEDHGYYTLSYLDRIAGTSPYLTEVENQRLENDAVNEICRLDLLGIYKRVKIQ